MDNNTEETKRLVDRSRAAFSVYDVKSETHGKREKKLQRRIEREDSEIEEGE